MTEDDEVFLKSYNQKRAPSAQLSDTDFEKIMEVYEDTAYIKTPFASIDQTIVSYDEMFQGLQDLDTAKVLPHAKQVYEYWKQRRQALSNKPLHPTLKFETHQDSDDMDPYVCFRRREVRQTRKTRARDVQSADKLKKLRKELEEGRQLVILSRERELLKAEMLKNERAIFEARASLKQQKIRLGIKTDDEDLINQKVSASRTSISWTVPSANPLQPQKRKAPEAPAIQRPPAPSQLRVTARNDNRSSETDLAQLADRKAERERELRADLEKKVQNHGEWNKNHIDLTRGPLSPVEGPRPNLSFRPAKTQYLMTPPASASSDSLEEPTPMDLDKPMNPNPTPVYRFVGVAPDENSEQRMFRLRRGRLDRLWVDRRPGPPTNNRPPPLALLLTRPPSTPPYGVHDADSDQWKYDQSDDEDEDMPMYEVDPHDTVALKFRASIPPPAHLMAQFRQPVVAIPRPAIAAPPPTQIPQQPQQPQQQHPQIPTPVQRPPSQGQSAA